MRRIAIIATVLAIAASSAHAAGPRPWLCRDKPVFSSSRSMTYRLTSNSRSQWQLFLMQFSPGGSNDGFDIAKTATGSTSGHLPPGQYFAVALRRMQGSWICPADVDAQPRSSGTISDLCFAAREGGCDIKLVVEPESSSGTLSQ